MELLLAIGIILLSSVLIYFAGRRFAIASSKLGDALNLPRSVKGATFDAVSSSMPELLVDLFAVLFFHTFEVGIGTIAGSALFNLLVIPGICVFVAPVAFKVSGKVITRDALYYLMAVLLLIGMLIAFKTWGLLIAALFLFGYLLYVKSIISHTQEHKKKHHAKRTKGLVHELLVGLVTLLIISAATFFLTKYSVLLSELLGIAPVIIAFTITAAATSVPDTVISIVNARKGSIDDAASNVFGSNVFDILIGIGLPLLIYVLYKGVLAIDFTHMEIVFGLLGSTILLIYFFRGDHTLNRREAALLLLMYVLFVIYVILLSVL